VAARKPSAILEHLTGFVDHSIVDSDGLQLTGVVVLVTDMDMPVSIDLELLSCMTSW
jgi:hypothetical protein